MGISDYCVEKAPYFESREGPLFRISSDACLTLLEVMIIECNLEGTLETLTLNLNRRNIFSTAPSQLFSKSKKTNA